MSSPPDNGFGPMDRLDAAGAFVTAALLIVVGLGGTGPIRVALALAFMTFVPGWTVMAYVPLARGASGVAVAAALSLSLCALASLVVLWFGAWDPRALVNLLGAVCLLALAWRLAHPRPAVLR